MATSNPSIPQRIALVRLSHLGDVVLTLPLFHALRAAFPRAEIAWVVQSEFASLLEGLPGLERVIHFRRHGGARAWMDLRAALAAFAPDLAVDAQANLKSGFALLVTGAARRVGVARSDYRERLGAFAATEFAPTSTGAHAMERTQALCRHLVGSGELRCDAALSSKELGRGRELWRSHCGSPRTVILQLSNSRDVRSWPLERAVEFARACARVRTAVLALSGPGEVDEGRAFERLTAGEPLVQHCIDQRGLRELAALFTAAAADRAQFVGADTGPTHLAAACGMRVTVLCGPQSHARTGPWPMATLAPERGDRHTAVRAALELPCAPCFARRCRHPLGPVCMSELSADHVRMATSRDDSA